MESRSKLPKMNSVSCLSIFFSELEPGGHFTPAVKILEQVKFSPDQFQLIYFFVFQTKTDGREFLSFVKEKVYSVDLK